MNTLDLYVSVSKKVYIIMNVFVVTRYCLYSKEDPDVVVGVFYSRECAEKIIEQNDDDECHFRIWEEELQ